MKKVAALQALEIDRINLASNVQKNKIPSELSIVVPQEDAAEAAVIDSACSTPRESIELHRLPYEAAVTDRVSSTQIEVKNLPLPSHESLKGLLEDDEKLAKILWDDIGGVDDLTMVF